MHVSRERRAEHAAAVPVYVRASGEAWELVDSASDELLSQHATSRAALAAALELEAVQRAEKRANLREDGEPIGEWRWLDASAEEDEPIDGARITAASIWEMAASLNERKSAIPINGGGAPRPGLGDSVPHGDAYTGGDHLANGYAHVALPVLDGEGRTHLFLHAELLPEIAREVDLGRLAYGSIRFGFNEVGEDDNYGIKGAVLISHALTNDPAVTTLTAGSERRRESEPAFVAMRSMRTSMGPANTRENTVTTAESKRARREELGDMPPEAVEDFAADAIVLMEEILDKPDADPVELLAELEARKEELAEAVGTDAPAPEGEMSEDREGDEDEKKDEEEGTKSRSRSRQLASLRKRVTAIETELAAERSKVQRFEARAWLDEEIAKRKLAVNADKRTKWTELSIAKGREVVTEILDAQSRPPTTNPIDTLSAQSAPAPKSYREAVDACMSDAREQLRDATDRRPQVVRARAQKLAAERFPDLIPNG
jgi:hypothetical protein